MKDNKKNNNTKTAVKTNTQNINNTETVENSINNDTTVNVTNIIKFCKDNKLKYKIINNGKHELYGHDNEIIDFILNN